MQAVAQTPGDFRQFGEGARASAYAPWDQYGQPAQGPPQGYSQPGQGPQQGYGQAAQVPNQGYGQAAQLPNQGYGQAAQAAAPQGGQPPHSKLLRYIMRADAIFTARPAEPAAPRVPAYYKYAGLVASIAFALVTAVAYLWLKKRGAAAPVSDFVPIGGGPGLHTAGPLITPRTLVMVAVCAMPLVSSIAESHYKGLEREAARAHGDALAKAARDRDAGRVAEFQKELAAASGKQIEDTLRALAHLSPKCPECHVLLLEAAVSRGLEIPTSTPRPLEARVGPLSKASS